MEAYDASRYELENPDVVFPLGAHPKMNPCQTCGKMFFPWSLKTHQKRCGMEVKSTAPSTAAVPGLGRRDSIDDGFDSLSEGSLRMGAEPVTTHRITQTEARQAGDRSMATFTSSRAVNDGKMRIATKETNGEGGDEPQQRIARPRGLIDLSSSNTRGTFQPAKDSIFDDGRDPGMEYQDIDESLSRLTVQRRPVSNRMVARSDASMRTSGPSFSSPSTIVAPTIGPKTPLRPPVNSRIPRTPQTPQSPLQLPNLSEKAREERERAERQRQDREEQLLAERARLQKEIDRVNDELRSIRYGRPKTSQTITPNRLNRGGYQAGSGTRRPSATSSSAPPKMRSRFDDRLPGYNPKGIDPSNATSPDNPLATSIYQVMPHPPIVQRGSANKFTI